MEDEEDNDDDYLNDDDPWLKLVPEGENEIVSEAVWNYRSTFLPTDNLDKALQQFNKLEAALTKCLVDHKKKLLTKEELGEIASKGYIRGVSYTKAGHFEKDINTSVLYDDINKDIKYEILIGLYKASDTDNKYQIFISIQNKMR